MKALVLLERESDCADARSWAASIDGVVIFVSLSPEVSWNLEQFGIPYSTPVEYTDETKIYEQGLKHFEIVQEIADILDVELAPIHGRPSITPARYAVYHLKMLWDVLFTTISVLEGVFQREKPDLVRIYAHSFKNHSQYAFNNEESVYASVLRLNGWTIKCEIADCRTAALPRNNPKGVPNIFVRLKKRLQRYSIFLNLSVITANFGKIAAIRSFIQFVSKSSETSLILYGDGYNWDDTLPEFFNNGITDIIRVRDDLIGPPLIEQEKYIDIIIEICRKNDRLCNLANIGNIYTESILFDKIAWIISRSIAESLFTYDQMVSLIHDRQVTAVLLSAHISSIGYTTVKAAYDCGIPVLSWQHGGGGYCYHPMAPFVESIGSNIHLVFGEGVADSYRKTYQRLNLAHPPIFVPVGSSSLDQVRSSIAPLQGNRERLQILYVTTIYLHNIYYISLWRNPSAQSEKYWSIHKSIIDLADSHPEVDFTIKLHPSHMYGEPLKRYACAKGIKNITFVINEQSLIELIQRSDILLFDQISTGILQGLQTNLPIFLFTGAYPLDDEVIYLLSKRVSCSADVYQFIKDIDNFLKGNTHRSSVDVTNDEFITAFGIFKGDSSCADRAIKVLMEVIQEKKV